AFGFAQKADDLLVSKTFLHVQSPRGRELDSKLRRYSKLGGRRLTSPVNQPGCLPPDATAYDAYSMGRAPHFAALKRASRTFRCAASRPAIKSGIAVVACLHCAVADLFGDAEAFAQVAGVGAGAVSAGGAAQHLA
ncbi:hypothetical protein, partial [Xanthomonas campestris]|uniref:hypothetical protein n=2 Tax=Xanthomonas campestris TaxID=339 RepID=UPI0039C45171